MSVVLKASREGIDKLSVLRVEQHEMDDRLGSLTTNIYFNMRIKIIRIEWTIQIFENMKIQKKTEIFLGIFSIILPPCTKRHWVRPYRVIWRPIWTRILDHTCKYRDHQGLEVGIDATTIDMMY
jgi:hypothetical protein